MKKLIPLCLSAIVMTMASFSAFAESGGAGNGGDAIVCPNEVILLDSYEAQKMRLTIDLVNPRLEKQTWRSMVNVAVKRLERMDKVTASLLYDYAMEMVNDFEKFEMYPEVRGKHVYLGYDIIAEINDSEHVSTPDHCEKHPRQLVSQRVPRFRFEYRYEFSKSLWEKMSLQEQSMTILHEAWYRIMLENGAKNSRAARYINGLVASKEFESFTFSDYIQEIKETELRNFIVENKSNAVKERELKIDLKNFDLTYHGEEVCVPNLKVNMSIKETYTLINRAQRYLTNTKFQDVCFSNTTLTKMVLPQNLASKKVTLRLPFHQADFKKSLDSKPTLFFHDNGRLSHFSGIQFGNFVEMYYVCDGKVSYTKKDGCEKGPFINHDTKIKNPQSISFDKNEKPIGVFQR